MSSKVLIFNLCTARGNSKKCLYKKN